MQTLRQTLGDVSSFVHLTALDWRMAPEGPPDRLGQRLSAIDDEQAADSRVEAAADQIVQQRLDRGGVLCDPLDHSQRMLGAVPVDTHRSQQHKVFADVQPVDLDSQQVELGQVGGHPRGHALG